MIQILGLRTYTDKRGLEAFAEKFFERKWRANSVPELFAKLPDFMRSIPQDEKYNLFYTLSDCLEESGRKFVSQEIIPIDIDNMDMSRYEDYITVITRVLNLDRDKIGIVYSGNGLHFLIRLEKPFTTVDYFEDNKPYYKILCGIINQELYKHGLQGMADPVVFSRGRMLRLPMTKNLKNGVYKDCFVINANMEPHKITLAKLADLPELNDGDYIHPKAYVRLPEPDTHGVLEGCDYIKYCAENPAALSEPQWYAMLSIVARLQDGRSLAHKYSEGHPDYVKEKTDSKIEQALSAAGPRTCTNIESLWDGCSKCPHYQKCKSPIMIKSSGYIKSKDTGFYEVSYSASGAIQRKPDYDGLARYFGQVHDHVALEDSGIVFAYIDNYWQEIPRQRIHAFAEDHFSPSPKNQMCMEFESKLKRMNLKNQDWFNPQGYVNFKNGVLTLETGEIVPHSPDYGFRFILPYDYDSTALCPRFDKFLDEVTLEDEEIKDLLLEFMGYAISGIDPTIGQKALILFGNGSNGKSVLMDVMKNLAGKDNYTTVSVGKEIHSETGRYALAGKLFNISEETPKDAMIDNTVFKALVSGGEVQARRLYCDSFNMKNYAKIIMACNKLPTNYDDSNGMYRRLLIVPFNATFTEVTKDPFLLDTLRTELTGIFNRAFMGLKRFEANKGRFTSSEQVEKHVQDYKQDSHPLSFFIEEECIVEDGMFITSVGLYGRYKVFSESVGMKPLDIRYFSNLLTAYLMNIYGRDTRSRKNNLRGFSGIDLKQGGDF